MKVGTSIRLQSFNGTQEPPPEVAPSENYWRLIGTSGTVVEGSQREKTYFAKTERVCVQFQEDINALGLHSHNDIENSLWILKSDLLELED
ncbi:MAG: hypothetical protein ACQKBW_00360 [Puniceicoccales bacterium]